MTIPSNAIISGDVAYTVDTTAPYTVTAWNISQPDAPYLSQPFDPSTGQAWASASTATTWFIDLLASNAAADGNRQILISNLTTLVSGMSSQVTQAQADLVTISGSTDLLAPVIGRNIQGSLDLAQGISDILSLLNILG